MSPSIPKTNAGHKAGAIVFIEVLLLLALTCGVSFWGEVQQYAYNTSATATSVASNATNTAMDAIATANQVKANATAVAMANASPIAYPPTNTSPVFDDPLQDNTKGYQWEAGDPATEKCTFINRTYDINAQYQEKCFARNTDFTDFIYEVQMKIVKGDGGGIAFRADPTSPNTTTLLSARTVHMMSMILIASLHSPKTSAQPSTGDCVRPIWLVL